MRAKSVSSVPGATTDDVPWLKLVVTEQRGDGTLSHVSTVQRINTKGGAVQGPCEAAGPGRSVPHSAGLLVPTQGQLNPTLYFEQQTPEVNSGFASSGIRESRKSIKCPK